MRKIIPRANQVVVVPDPEESRENEAGIITPGNVEQEQRAIGTVEAVGAGVDDIKKGDRVIYGAFAGEDLELNTGKKVVKYKILFAEDVLAFIED